MRQWVNLMVCLLVTVMFGCGGGGGSSSTNPTDEPTPTITGQFIDSAVSGLKYSCSSGLTGETDISGYFTCEENDTVTFYLGEYVIGSSDAKSIVTPYDLFPDNEVAAINVAQLLQTIDENNDPSDGITIPDNFTDLDGVTTSPESDTFEENVQIKLNKTLVGEIDAKAHLEVAISENAPFIVAYLQWRTYEDPANDKIRGWLTLPQEMTFEDVSDIRLEDAEGSVIAGFASFVESHDNYLIYDCRGEECTSVINEDYGYYLNLSANTAVGTYSYVLSTTSGEVYEKTVVYQGQIELPVVASETIVPQWDALGNLTVDWNGPSWIDSGLKDQVRVNVDAGTGTAVTIIVKLKPTQPSIITIPSSVIDSVFDETDSNWIKVSIERRAYDESGDNYARSYSDRVELGPEPISIYYRPINQVGTGLNNQHLSEEYGAIDLLTVEADISDPQGVRFTLETRADYQNASIESNSSEIFALSILFDRNTNDMPDYVQDDGWEGDADLLISRDSNSQNLQAPLFGCPDSSRAPMEFVFNWTQQVTPDGTFLISVFIPWSDLNACQIYQETPIKFMGVYSNDTTRLATDFP